MDATVTCNNNANDKLTLNVIQTVNLININAKFHKFTKHKCNIFKRYIAKCNKLTNRKCTTT